MVAGQRRTPARRVSRREAIRRRRANVLFVLAMVTVLTLFLAATTKSSGLVYAFALSFVSLCGYCYKLAQLRQYERDSQYSDVRWFNAA
jgi:Flp pilus assembly protein TadB